MRNKGKVHPSSSSSSSPVTGDTLAVLNLLPAAILTLAVVLSVEDREVLAYMLTHSIKSTNPNNNNNNSSKKGCNAHTHKQAPVFECDCFDCYTSYWFKWDTSPNRELIHQAIEAFEEQLNNSEHCSNNNNNKRGKKKEKVTHRKFAGKCSELPVKYDVALVVTQPEGEVLSDAVVESPETKVVTAEKTTETVTVREQNRGVGRKVVPDVIGILNWRLWNIWSPNV